VAFDTTLTGELAAGSQAPPTVNAGATLALAPTGADLTRVAPRGAAALGLVAAGLALPAAASARRRRATATRP
jgi:hypothetical protein